jgi:hypothetical protein
LGRRSLDDQLGTSDAGDRLSYLSFGVFRTSNLATTIPGLEAGGVITISQTEMPVLLPLLAQLMPYRLELVDGERLIERFKLWGSTGSEQS